MEATKVLTVIAVLAVVAAAFGLIVNLSTLQNVGYASSDIGNATLTVEGVANINFSNALIDWGTGSVDNTGACEPLQRAILDTDGTVDCGVGFGTVSQGLVLDNIGNTNVSVDLVSSNDAATFIGGDSVTPEYQWQVEEEASTIGSCPTASPGTYTDVNTVIPGTEICANFGNPTDGYSNKLEINLRVVLPQNTPATSKLSQLTATATVIP